MWIRSGYFMRPDGMATHGLRTKSGYFMRADETVFHGLVDREWIFYEAGLDGHAWPQRPGGRKNFTDLH